MICGKLRLLAFSALLYIFGNKYTQNIKQHQRKPQQQLAKYIRRGRGNTGNDEDDDGRISPVSFQKRGTYKPNSRQHINEHRQLENQPGSKAHECNKTRNTAGGDDVFNLGTKTVGKQKIAGKRYQKKVGKGHTSKKQQRHYKKAAAGSFDLAQTQSGFNKLPDLMNEVRKS